MLRDYSLWSTSSIGYYYYETVDGIKWGTPESFEYLAGERAFRISELEVFKLE